MANIFERSRLRPAQLRTVAERRFGDARCLRDSAQNERANGAMYLAGFVLECLLKSRLLEKHRWLQNPSLSSKATPAERLLWSLCYRSHDLDELLAQLAEVVARFSKLAQGERDRLTQSLRRICAEWTIFAR
jgi:hypothetical protein